MSLEIIENGVKRTVNTVVIDQTASRAGDGTVYRNTSGKVRQLIITTYLECTAPGDSAGLVVWSDNANPPTTNMGTVVITTNSLISNMMLVAIIQPNHYYRVTSVVAGTGFTSIARWMEIDFN